MMKLIFRVGLAAMLQVLLLHPANAQWHGEVGMGMRAVAHAEYDRAGRRLVREHGWLPGVALNAAYKAGDITWLAAADGYQSSIDYQGQTQAGAAADSTTSTRLVSARAGAAYAVGSDYSILAALEFDHWKRDIRGIGAAAGLQETYRSRRLVAGLDKVWHTAGGAVSANAGVIFSEPERLRVEFSGLFDPASLETERSHGIRIGAGIRPGFAPRLEFRTTYDRITIPRSKDAPVTANGQFRGTVAQPEHSRQAFTVTVSYLL
jgi:hypothetical protein